MSPPRFTRSPHLVTLVAEAERLAALVAAAPTAERDRIAPGVHDAATLASVRLDGGDLHHVPAPDAIAAARAVVGVTAPDAQRHATWFEAMRIGEDLDPAHTAQLQALEYAGVRDALAADDLVAPLRTDPLAALGELHRRLTQGLVAPERAGAPRGGEQAVHDAANGRVLFFTVDPARVPTETALLGAWLTSTGAREHGLITAGVAHLELLRIHPYDAANGRLARAASRLLLRGHGLDPDGLAAPEPTLDTDRLGYHDEVARTLRRRDLTIWLERWAEAVTAGLRTAARGLRALPAEVDDRAAAFVAERSGAVFTVADHRAERDLDAAASTAELQALLDTDRIARVPGSRGLRFRAR